MHRTGTIAVTVASLATVGLVVYLFEVLIQARQLGEAPSFFAPGVGEGITWRELILLVIVAVAGQVASHLFERMRQGEGPVSITAELRAMVHSRRFWMALLVSPLVFMSVYVLIKDRPHTVVDYLLAFQNGFWWETVLRPGTPGGASPDLAEASTEAPASGPTAASSAQPAMQEPNFWSRPGADP